MNSLYQLPSELILLILQHVNRVDLLHCALINRRFYTLTMPVLWQWLSVTDSPDLDLVMTTLEQDAKQQQQQPLGHYVRSIYMVSILTDPLLARLVQYVPFLESLEICHGKEITDTSMRTVAYHCPNLTRLLLSVCSITEASITAIGQYCQQLTHLRLHYTTNLSSNLVLDAMGTSFPGLDFLDLSKNHHHGGQLTHHDVRRLVCHSCPLLKTFILGSCGIHPADFPEIIINEEECLSYSGYKEYGSVGAKWVEKLDQDAINNIRLASNNAQWIGWSIIG